MYGNQKSSLGPRPPRQTIWEALGISPYYGIVLAVLALADIAFIVSYLWGML